MRRTRRGSHRAAHTVQRISRIGMGPRGDAGIPGGVVMFFTYLRRELRRRMRQAIFIALVLALGIGLVITVTAASSGVKSAEGKVLHSLYGVGTDVTVTNSPKAGSGGPQGFRIAGRSRGSGATKVNRDSLVSAGLGTLSTATLTQISHLKHVSAATGALSLTD